MWSDGFRQPVPSMPITHKVRPDGILELKRWGVLSIAEEIASLHERLVDPAIVAGSRVLVDSRELVGGDSSELVKHLAVVAQTTAERLECGAIALVVSSDIAYGMARMYMGLTDAQHPTTEVFRDYDEALAWLTANPAGRPASPDTKA